MKYALLLLARTVLFGGLSAVAIMLFAESSIALATGILQSADVVFFKPHLAALFGMAITSLGILTWLMIEQISGKPPSKSAAKWSGRALVTGFTLMLALPILLSTTIPPLLQTKGYSRCEQGAYPFHLPGMGEKVYTRGVEHCKPWEEYR